MRPAILLLLAASTSVLVGCGPDPDTVQIDAAASLAGPFDELADDYAAASGNSVELNVAASSTLVRQIEAGAEPDVLATADVETMRRLTDDFDVFAGNELVLAVATDDPDAVAGLADLEDGARTVALCAADVPCGRVADRVLAAAEVVPATATREPDAAATASKLVLGEVDAALIYRSDVLAHEQDLTAVPGGLGDVPEDLASTEYAITALDEQGRGFLDFVVGAEGRAVLARWGFAPA